MNITMDIKEFEFVSSIPKDVKGIGVAIITLRSGDIYLTKRLNTGEFGCPGGKVDETKDFSLEDAARRELFEETGLKINEDRLYWIGYQKVTTNSTDYTCWYILILKDGETLENVESDKHGDWIPYLVKDALKLPLFCGTKACLKNIIALINR